MALLSRLVPTIICALLVQPPPGVAASRDARDAVNELRARGCDGRAGVVRPLRPDRGLDGVAARLAQGVRLGDAVDGKGYRAAHSASIHISNVSDDAAIERMLRAQFCEESTNPEFENIGVAQEGRDTWIVIARRFNPPAENDARRVSERILELTNHARAAARLCGSKRVPAAPRLRLQRGLERAANVHARDLAKRGTLSHRGADGSSPSLRAARANYVWHEIGENVAAGQTTPEAAVQGWLDSPLHCANLMNPSFTEMGLGYAVNLDSPDGIYWVQLFGAPR